MMEKISVSENLTHNGQVSRPQKNSGIFEIVMFEILTKS